MYLKLLRDTTIPSLPILRSLARDTVLDVLFYCSPHYHNHIIEQAKESLLGEYKNFLSFNPEFRSQGGKVLLIAHSLGSVIAFDCLEWMVENIDVCAVFALGSPLGLFLPIRRCPNTTYTAS